MNCAGYSRHGMEATAQEEEVPAKPQSTQPRSNGLQGSLLVEPSTSWRATSLAHLLVLLLPCCWTASQAGKQARFSPVGSRGNRGLDLFARVD